MKYSIPIVALFAAFTTPIALAQSCGPVTVGAAGGANCTTANLQDAINKATNDALCFDNEVWISDSIDGAFFNGGKISINGKEVAKFPSMAKKWQLSAVTPVAPAMLARI